MTSDADLLHRELDKRLPAEHAALFHLEPAAERLAATQIEDPDWLTEQIRLRGVIWGIENPKILGTLWWYSASAWLVTPPLASLAITGTALSAKLDDIVLHRLPDSRFSGSRSTAIAGANLDTLADQIATSFDTTIAALRPFTGPHARPLWAIGADAIATRLLWVGRPTGRIAETSALLAPIADAIGARMPRPRFIDIPIPKHQYTSDADCHRAVDRVSCCLLYKVPDKPRCSGCPGIRQAARHQLMLARSGLAAR